MPNQSPIEDQIKTHKHRFLMLLCVLIFFIIITPFVDPLFEHTIIVDIIVTAVFIAAMYSIVRKKHHVVIGVLLALPMVISVWLGYVIHSTVVVVIGHIFGILFIGFAILQLIGFVLASGEVTREVLFAAIIIYLLMALMWSFAYIVLESMVPGSFNMRDSGLNVEQFVFLYYSFVTITTLGYGDITPLTQQAGALTILEAIVGQIYLVVLVAFLVGMFVSRRAK
jgi:hypothetical protein